MRIGVGEVLKVILASSRKNIGNSPRMKCCYTRHLTSFLLLEVFSKIQSLGETDGDWRG